MRRPRAFTSSCARFVSATRRSMKRSSRRSSCAPRRVRRPSERPSWHSARREAEGDRLIDGAKAEVRRLAGEIEGLERSRRAYLAQLRAMVARQLAELEAIPETTAAPVASGRAWPSGGRRRERRRRTARPHTSARRTGDGVPAPPHPAWLNSVPGNDRRRSGTGRRGDAGTGREPERRRSAPHAGADLGGDSCRAGAIRSAAADRA